ncbi:hypothetical protein [Rossellomorea vietnamensis]|uniref:Uncharacterized protein n=1 Tax=Rossellomorea vietnamensis TaxID=218284 RepID=A0A6I6UQF4_9BACI|nr:hypothetical protein [Rossellomorea vietnamensis]OXS55699.1 hypothetical protein B1B00_18500 [Bacillus sp. DSM 27956]PRX71180.1 hypothetical protein B0G93_12629 [Bacillus sp. V-88]QHE61063.1 hypothetical protein FHE72_08560 [Rossellomorea vietnamensis]SLK24518.1 hypothetical protein SAMN06295884_12629 [Bacillus sp. V-88]
MKSSITKLEGILWSIALPGFPQLLVGLWFKGTLFVLLEIMINIQSNFNLGIMYSFLGETHKAAEILDYQWLMFYPCLYMFAMWDAYKIADGQKEKYSFLPFVMSAYTVTVGLMYSPKVYLFGKFIGPIFLPMLFVIPGVLLGLLIRAVLIRVK